MQRCTLVSKYEYSKSKFLTPFECDAHICDISKKNKEMIARNQIIRCEALLNFTTIFL